MRRHWIVMALAGAAAAWCAAPLAVARAAEPAAGGVWRKAIEVPGLGRLNVGGFAKVISVSCGAAGDCAAGGFYSVGSDGSEQAQAFVVSERNGRWGKALEVPGSGALNARGIAKVNSVSCGAAGNCAAGGFYTDASFHSQAFVVSERNGRWGEALEVPGSGALNVSGSAEVNSVSCGAAGHCVAGGSYFDGSDHLQGFVVGERNGRWGEALEVPGSGALNPREFAEVISVSCGAAGNCAAGGDYAIGPGRNEAFVVSERNGHWGKALKVPGSGALNAGGTAEVNSVSCGAAGDCAAGGLYVDASFHVQAFVVSERNGRWGKALKVPGSGALNAGGSAEVNSVSCGAAGDCAAGGPYKDRSGHVQAFVVSERDGRWGKAIEVPGSGALNAHGFAQVNSVSCGSAGDCVAGGFYKDGSGHVQAFVVSERNGRWGKALEVPGSGALNAGGHAEVNSVWCGPVGSCAAGGFYDDRSHATQGFVVSRS